MQGGALRVAPVLAADDLGDEAAIGFQIDEGYAATQEQGVVDGALEMALGAFDGAVLMSAPRLLRDGVMP